MSAGIGAATERLALADWTLHLGDAPPAAPAEVVRALSGGIPAQVPGSVLGTLIAAGLATDVTIDGREEDVAWASSATWSYRTSIAREGDGARVRLVLAGVDTLATVKVDGQVALVTDDMFHGWTVDLGVDETPGRPWSIEVELHPVLPVIEAAQAAHPLPRADMYEIPFNQIRKMACSFGWDWGPTTITAGLWRAATVERTPTARFEQVLLSPTWLDRAVLRGTVTVEGEAQGLALRVRRADDDELLLAHSAALVDGVAELELEVPGARRWDVVSRGDQPLYDLEIDVLGADGATVDTATRRIGFRRVELVQELDDVGRSFEIHVNGSRVWARGFNWIPADVLPERVDRERLRHLITEAVATGANMLRVWGGGVIESDDFYDLCDELGVLVWQDFSFACATYAEDEAQVARVRREVADAVQRVGHRTSLVLWCGSNENEMGWADWGWQDELGKDAAWGAGLYREVIPAALAALDPARPYIPSSPFSPEETAHPNDPTQGPTHHWDTWNQLDYVAFEDKSSRFAAEFGWQAPAAWPTLVRAIGHPPTSGSDPDLQRLQKHPEGQTALARAISDHLPHLPTDGPGWHLATQLVQARAIRASIGRFRSLHDSCSGALWWQLNDCWPALSWAVLDVAGRRKLGWHAAAEVMAPRAVVTTAAGDAHGLTLVNDVPQDWQVTGTLRVADESGAVLHEEPIDVVVVADGHLVVTPERVPDGAAVVVVDVAGIRGARWIVPDLELAALPADLLVTGVERVGDEARVTVRARTLVRDLVLLAEHVPGLADARVEGQLMLLLPGDVATITVHGPGVGAVPDRELTDALAAGTALTAAREA